MPNEQKKFTLSEDWWAVIVAFILVILVAVAKQANIDVPIKF